MLFYDTLWSRSMSYNKFRYCLTLSKIKGQNVPIKTYKHMNKEIKICRTTRDDEQEVKKVPITNRSQQINPHLKPQKCPQYCMSPVFVSDLASTWRYSCMLKTSSAHRSYFHVNWINYEVNNDVLITQSIKMLKIHDYRLPTVTSYPCSYK